MINLDLQISILFHIWYMALTFRQVNCSALALSLSQLFSLDLQMSKYRQFNRVCPAHIFSKSTNSLQNHGKSWKFPSALTAVAGGKGILFPWNGVLFRPKCGKMNEYFYKGLNRLMELTISIH